MENLGNTEQNNVQAPQEQETQTPPQGQKTSWGPVIGLIIILGLIIAGSFYFFSKEQINNDTTQDPSVENIENELSDLRNQSESDELDAIEADLDATDLDNLDAEIELIEEEL